MAKIKNAGPAPLPRDHLLWAHELGLREVTFLHVSREVEGNRRCWVPRDLIALDGSCCILYRPADREYDFDGWQPEHNHWFGGRYRDINQALHWIETAKGVAAGTIADFRGA